MTDTAAGPWTTGHQLVVRRQWQTRPGPLDKASGVRWAETRETGLVLAACNCGYTTGWIPRADLPSRAELGTHGYPT